MIETVHLVINPGVLCAMYAAAAAASSSSFCFGRGSRCVLVAKAYRASA